MSDLQDDRTCFRLDIGRYAVITREGYSKSFADLLVTVWELS